MDLIQRPRRLRGSENLRKMVRETRMDKSSLIYPLFVKEGTGIEEEISKIKFDCLNRLCSGQPKN